LVSLNDEILGHFQRQWEDPRSFPENWHHLHGVQDYVERIRAEIERNYSDGSLLLINDPRLCRLLPLYMEALHALNIEPLVVLQVRPVAEVAQSLADRDDLAHGLGSLLWLRLIAEAEWYSRHLPRVWVSFRQATSDWRGAVNRIGEKLNVTWPIHPDDAAEAINMILKPRPRQVASCVDNEVLTGAWSAVQEGLAGNEPAARAGFDGVRASLEEIDAFYLGAMSHHISRLEAQLQAMRHSTCWRLTAPLRALASGLTQAQSVMRGQGNEFQAPS
jgi:hypothetical protein